MNSIVNGNKIEGSYWLGQINAPKYVKNLIVLNRLGLEPEHQRVTLNISGEEVTCLKIPLVDIGFVDEDSIHDAILAAMGYAEEHTT